MPPLPYQPREIVGAAISVNNALRAFFYDNSHLSTISGITHANKSNTPAPNAFPLPSCKELKDGPIRPGVVLDVTPDFATLAMFTTLHGKALSDIRGLLRTIVAPIHPVNAKRDPAASDGLQLLAVHPTWCVPEAGKQTLCLCLKHRVPIDELKPWSWKGEPAIGVEKFVMCRPDFKLLQELCERNERLRGLFASEIRRLVEELNLDDVVKRGC